MRLNNSGNPPQCWCVKPVITCEPDMRLKPELRFRPTLSNMNMRRFERIAFVRVEEKAQPIKTKNDWHRYKSICPVNTVCPSGSRGQSSARSVVKIARCRKAGIVESPSASTTPLSPALSSLEFSTNLFFSSSGCGGHAKEHSRNKSDRPDSNPRTCG